MEQICPGLKAPGFGVSGVRPISRWLMGGSRRTTVTKWEIDPWVTQAKPWVTQWKTQGDPVENVA
jgi:hypothetical protein